MEIRRFTFCHFDSSRTSHHKLSWKMWARGVYLMYSSWNHQWLQEPGVALNNFMNIQLSNKSERATLPGSVTRIKLGKDVLQK